MAKEVVEFWDDKDNGTRQEIVKVIAKQLSIDVKDFVIDVDFSKLPATQQAKLRRYYKEWIKPQLGKQQIKYDGIIEEKISVSCPRCQQMGTVKYVITKRGLHLKCSACGWDSNVIHDVYERESRIKQCAGELKKLFPKLSYVVNTVYAPDAYLTGQLGERSKKYDIGCFWMGLKVARCRTEVSRNIKSEKKFFEAEQCYVIGIPSVIDYMSKKRGICIHFLPDSQDKKIGMSRIDIIKKYCPTGKDKFSNIQYMIPKEIRPLIVTFDRFEMENMLFSGFHRQIYRNAQIW